MNLQEIVLIQETEENFSIFGFDKVGKNQFSLGESQIQVVAPDEGSATLPWLDHIGILLPDRISLAALLLHLAESNAAIIGATDHGVCESIYVKDASGLTLEFYAENPAGEWVVDSEGALRIHSSDLNIDALLLTLKGKYKPWKRLPAQAKLGHIHVNYPEIEQIFETLRDIPNSQINFTEDGTSLYFGGDTGLYQLRISEMEPATDVNVGRLKRVTFASIASQIAGLQASLPDEARRRPGEFIIRTQAGMEILFQSAENPQTLL